MATKISTSTFTNKLKVHRDKEIFADAIAHNFNGNVSQACLVVRRAGCFKALNILSKIIKKLMEISYFKNVLEHW